MWGTPRKDPKSIMVGRVGCVPLPLVLGVGTAARPRPSLLLVTVLLGIASPFVPGCEARDGRFQAASWERHLTRRQKEEGALGAPGAQPAHLGRGFLA